MAFISAAQAFPFQGNSELHMSCKRADKHGNFSCVGRQWRCALPITSTDTPYGPNGKCVLRTIPFTYHCADKKCHTIAGLTCITENPLTLETLLPAPGGPVCVPFLPVKMTRISH